MSEEGEVSRDTHLTENPRSEAAAPAQLCAAGASLDTGDAPSLGLQGAWPQDREEGRHSSDFMTAEDTRLLME